MWEFFNQYASYLLVSTVARLVVGGSKSGRDLERRLIARGENHGLYIPNEPVRDLLLHNQEEDVGRVNPPRVKLTGDGVMYTTGKGWGLGLVIFLTEKN
ncbi:hypothetical protein OUZ56_021801 [Daphnia magna]|uniref:Uncharacterized protein n=1 Tax=Daphnia magna TaxID=35525 RepID=A0ABR0AUI0_9CRUS|nr:hypothetical protein OUZ56_021801 [Daphnia magna]